MLGAVVSITYHDTCSFREVVVQTGGDAFKISLNLLHYVPFVVKIRHDVSVLRGTMIDDWFVVYLKVKAVLHPMNAPGGRSIAPTHS
jgi:hypothetical protein